MRPCRSSRPVTLTAALAVLSLAGGETALAQPVVPPAALATPASVKGLAKAALAPGQQGLPHVKRFLSNNGFVPHLGPNPSAPEPGTATLAPGQGGPALFAEGPTFDVQPLDGSDAASPTLKVFAKNDAIEARSATDLSVIKGKWDWQSFFGVTGGFFTDPHVWWTPQIGQFSGVIMWEQAANANGEHWRIFFWTSKGDSLGPASICWGSLDYGDGTVAGTSWVEPDYPLGATPTDNDGSNAHLTYAVDRYFNGASNATDIQLLVLDQWRLSKTSACPASFSGWSNLFPHNSIFAAAPAVQTDAEGGSTLNGAARAWSWPNPPAWWKATNLSTTANSTLSWGFVSGAINISPPPAGAQRGSSAPVDNLDGRPGGAQYAVADGTPVVTTAYGVPSSNGNRADAYVMSYKVSTHAVYEAYRVSVAGLNVSIPGAIRDRQCIGSTCTNGGIMGMSTTYYGTNQYPSAGWWHSTEPTLLQDSFQGLGPYTGSACKSGLCRNGDRYENDVSKDALNFLFVAMYADPSKPGGEGFHGWTNH